MKKALGLSVTYIVLLASCSMHETRITQINLLQKKANYCDSIHSYDSATFYYVKSLTMADSNLLASNSADKLIYKETFVSLTHKLTDRARYFQLRTAVNEDKNDIDSAGLYGRVCMATYTELLKYDPSGDTILSAEVSTFYSTYARFCACNNDFAHALYYYKDAVYWSKQAHDAKKLIAADRGLTKSFLTVKLSAKDSAAEKINLADSSFKYLALTCRDMDSLKWDKISPQEAYESYNLMAILCKDRKDTARYRLYADKCKNLNKVNQ